MKCEFGFCLACEKEISTKCEHCGSRKVTGQYTEVALPMNNGSQMMVAVCLDCASTLHSVDKKELMDAVKAAWVREHHKAKAPHHALEKHLEHVKELHFL